MNVNVFKVVFIINKWLGRNFAVLPFAISRLHCWLFKIRFRVWKWKGELILTKWIARKWSLICTRTLIYAWRLGGLKLFKCWWNYTRSFNGGNHWCRRETLRFAKYFFVKRVHGLQGCTFSWYYIFLSLRGVWEYQKNKYNRISSFLRP